MWPKSLVLCLFLLLAVTVSCTSCLNWSHHGRTVPEQTNAMVSIETWCWSNSEPPSIWDILSGKKKGKPMISWGAHMGTGVAIDDWNILTADHVVHCDPLDDGASWAVLQGGKRIKVEVVAEDSGMDVAKLRVVTGSLNLGVPPAVIAPTPEVGDEVCSRVSFPPADGTWHCGLVEKITGAENKRITHSAQTQHGNSGSGLYDAQGRLLGIVIEGQWCGYDPTDDDADESVIGSCGGIASALYGHSRFVPEVR